VGASLSDGAKEGLIRGLTFIPRTPHHPQKLEQDLKRLLRSINLKIHWTLAPSNNYQSSLVSRVLKSDWEPPQRLRETNSLWTELRSAAVPQGRVGPNHSSTALKDWKKLMNDERWYVLKADKGGKTVLWAREDYKKEALRQLQDSSTYEELTESQTLALLHQLHVQKIKVCRILLSLKCITSGEKKRILEQKTAPPAIYFLPKIHKERREDTGALPARPIIAAVGAPFKVLDEYLAGLTACLLPHIPGSLQDTAALLRDLAKITDLPPGAKLFSADVVSLYPSMDWEETLDASVEFYEEHFKIVQEFCIDGNMLPPPPPETFRLILKTLLENNIFHLQNSSFYRQLKGTAMGCSMSVFMANAFMYRKTRHLIERPPAQLLYFGRYIDDIIAVWLGTDEEIPALFNGVVDDNVKLTYVFGGKTIEALDIQISIEDDGSISTRLYRKPTEGTQFVHWSSAHPVNLKSSIPYAQLLRIKRNCTKNSDFLPEARSLLYKFKNRGYPAHVLDKACEKALAVPREGLLMTGHMKIQKEGEQRLVLVSDFHEPLVRPLRSGVRSFYEGFLKNPLHTEIEERYGPMFSEEPPMIAFRAGRSLGSMLGPVFKKGPKAPRNCSERSRN
jgi:hypothetical protein